MRIITLKMFLLQLLNNLMTQRNLRTIRLMEKLHPLMKYQRKKRLRDLLLNTFNLELMAQLI